MRVNSAMAISLAGVCFCMSALAGPAKLDSGGQGGMYGNTVYGPDRLYSSSKGAGAVGGTAVTPFLASSGQIIDNTSFAALFNNTRKGKSEYRFDVANGTYLLTMQFVELVMNGPGLRKFSVLAVPPAATTQVAALGGYDRNIVTWPEQAEPDLAGYRATAPDVSSARRGNGSPMWSTQSSPTPRAPNLTTRSTPQVAHR